MDKMVKFNLNNYVYFKLTEHGLDKLKKDHECLNSWCNGKLGDFKELKEDENGFVKMQAWRFMSHFGELMGNGLNSPVKECEIYFEEKDLK